MTNSTAEILREINIRPAVENINFRQYNDPDDLAALARVIQRSIKADRIDRVVTEEDIPHSHQHLANFDIETDMLVAEVERKLVGFVRVNWQEICEGQRTIAYRKPLPDLSDPNTKGG